ncbi:MAG: alpha/beta fold hydrolase, partial [Rhodothermales bacterium]
MEAMKGNISILLMLIMVAGGMGACRSGHGDAGDAPEAPPGRLVDVGSHRIHIFCLGEGLSTVVIDTGWGDASANWHSLQTRIARDTRVCVYDRAGYGWSEPGPEPRSSRQVVHELKRLLEAAGLEGPYVLVGHSLGGLNMHLFASQYPAMVAGVVLLDPPPMPFILGEAFPDLYQMADQTTLELQQAAAAARQASDTEE